MRVYLLRSTEVFCVPMAYCRIGIQFALSLAFSFLHDLAPMDPYRLLMYTQRVLWRSTYTMGAVGVGAEVDVGGMGLTMDGPIDGLGCVEFCIACVGCPIFGPVLPGCVNLGCIIVCVSSVGCKVKRTF
jgi:hypothetical protein